MSIRYNVVSKRLDNNLPSFLSLKGIKTYLRVDFNEDDNLLKKIGVVVCERAESFIKMNLLERIIRQVNYGLSDSKIKLYTVPVIKINKLFDKNNKEIPAELWSFNESSNHVVLCDEVEDSQIMVEYVSGFTKRNISQSIKYGLLEHIAYIYDGQSKDQEFPASSLDLYSSFRNRKVWR